ncbi:MAG: hypothetical protein WAT21_11840 [Saprospiraceae bacterium]
MNTVECNYDPVAQAYKAKLHPESINTLFSILIDNYHNPENLEDVIVSVTAGEGMTRPYEFNFVDMVQNADELNKALFVIPLDYLNSNPPYSVSLYSEEESIDISKWKVQISWN